MTGAAAALVVLAAAVTAAPVRDCAHDCPEMIAVSGGTFAMGTAPAEEDRAPSVDAPGDVLPLQTIRLHRFALAKYEVTRDEFAAFVDDTGYKQTGAKCWNEAGEKGRPEGQSWNDPGYAQTGRHPVVCIGRDDAHAYTAWLSRKTGHAYRLPSESEWEYGARAGTGTLRYWGDGMAEACLYANIADEDYIRAGHGPAGAMNNAPCHDGFVHTAPVGSLKANGFGLYDMLGNVSEVVEDCEEENNDLVPADGAPYKEQPYCRQLERGGSFDDSPRFVASAARYGFSDRNNTTGLRVARDLGPAETEATFSDCARMCPEMAALPGGAFEMGMAEGEEARENLPYETSGYSIPQHEVTVAPFLIGRTDVTRAEFAVFVRETGYSAQQPCWAVSKTGGMEKRADLDWRNPGFAQTDRDPVVCVSWVDAKAYAAWLSAKTKLAYRLPGEAEWEFAARAGSKTARPWGDGRGGACAFANAADMTLLAQTGQAPANDNHFACSDGYAYTSPATALAPNAFGLHDMLGNVWQWTEDCWNASYDIAPPDGRPWAEGECGLHPRRGGAWSSEPPVVRSAMRLWDGAAVRTNDTGFRVARSVLDAPPPPLNDPRRVVLVQARILHDHTLRALAGDPEGLSLGAWERMRLRVSDVLIGALDTRDIVVNLRMTDMFASDENGDYATKLLVLLDARSGGRMRALGWGRASDGVCVSREEAAKLGIEKQVEDLQARYPCPRRDGMTYFPL